MSAERRPTAPMPVRPSGRHPCARPLMLGRDRRAWARIDRHCASQWRCGAAAWHCGATTWRCGAAIGRRGPVTRRRPALMVRPLAQAEAKSPLPTVPLSSEGRRGVRRSTGRTSTSLPDRERASADGRFDMCTSTLWGRGKTPSVPSGGGVWAGEGKGKGLHDDRRSAPSGRKRRRDAFCSLASEEGS
jgi:hypothetical protein